jgi:hypothetical protein
VKLRKLLISVDDYHAWFERRGTSYEYRAFNALAFTMYSSIASFSSGDTVNFAVVSIAGITLRMAYLFLACLRLWLLALIFGIVSRVWNIRPHEANEFLGQVGNGRLYYSGIRAGVDKVADDGAPDVHVRGLICLPEVEHSTAEQSPIAKVLKRFEALNKTNTELLAIILAHPDYPSYLDHEKGLAPVKEAYADEGLIAQTEHLLSALLTLHQQIAGAGVDPEQVQTVSASEMPVLSETGGKVGPQVYAQMVSRAADRVLTSSLKKALAEVTPTHIATTVLAMQAAKCLGYEKTGGMWTEKTSFLQLSARAVLHSTANYSQEYAYQERGLIRQALIYASRRSVFGPVALPVDISRHVQALRSWSELLIALPPKLDAVADRVELYCLCWELQKRFRQGFCAGFKEGRQELVEGVYYSKQDMLFVPLKNVLRVLLQVVPKEIIDRMAELTAQASKLQQGESLYEDDDSQVEQKIPPYLKILAPLTDQELDTLVADHELTRKDLTRWDPLRMILFSYSWLGMQIGHVAVPDNSIVFAIMKSDDPAAQANELGLIGTKGMVPIRGSRLRESLNGSWRQYCVQVNSVAIADGKADFEALLRGEEAKGSEDLGSTKALAV